MESDRELPFTSDDDAMERETDVLMRLVAEVAFDELDPADPRNARFFDWYARELRQRRSAAERGESRRIATEFGTRNAERWAAKRIPVIAFRGEPRGRSTVPASLETLARIGELRAAAASFDDAIAAGPGRELWDQPCTELVDLPKGVPAGRHVVLRVSGDSMTPLMHAGDSVLVRVGDKVVPDTVIVARRPEEGYVVKRVGRILHREVELLSLNPAYPPIRIPRDPRLVLGTVVARWCAH